MSKDMRDWPRANLGVAANIFKHLKTTCRSECSSVPRVKTLENPQPEPDAESLGVVSPGFANYSGNGQQFWTGGPPI